LTDSNNWVILKSL